MLETIVVGATVVDVKHSVKVAEQPAFNQRYP